jgi:probable rRNA maturation factor
VSRQVFTLSVQYACVEKSLPERGWFRCWAKAALADSVCGEVTIRLVSPVEGQQLNRDYRGKDYATNILSFPYDIEPCLHGDLVICPAVVVREAVEQGKTEEVHYAHLTIHGILHLQGYDHADEAGAEVMEAHEREILAGLGYPDPYLSPD